MDTELSAIQQRINNLLRQADAGAASDGSAANDDVVTLAELEQRMLRMASRQGGGLKAFLDD
jgi:hypothetical protein